MSTARRMFTLARLMTVWDQMGGWESTPLRRAVILARGLGTRMQQRDAAAALEPSQAQVADAGLKAMIPIRRPFLDYVLSELADAGFEHACLVIGPEHQSVREYYTHISPPRRISVEFALQQEARGTADAVLAAEAFAGDGEFLVLNSDNYYPLAALKLLRTLGEPGTVLFDREALITESNIPAARVGAFAVGLIGENGYLADLVEKPDGAKLAGYGPNAPISMNCWRFSPAIFSFCRRVPPSPRRELELPLAVRRGIRTGELRLKAIRFRGCVLDLSRRADIAQVAERLRGIAPNP